MTSSDLPTREVLLQLLDRMWPQIEEVLRRWSITLEDAEKILDAAVFALLHQWNRVACREGWLLDRIEKAARRCKGPLREEAGYGEKTH